MVKKMLAIMNQKGGVGKTTTACNFSHALSFRGNKVLVIDLDPQAHLTASFGIKNRRHSGVDKIFLENSNPGELILSVRENLDLIPAGNELSKVERMESHGPGSVKILKDSLSVIMDQYDHIILDCPPSSGILALNALFASDELLIPVAGDYLSLHGLARFVDIIEQVEVLRKKKLNKWIVMTRYQERRKLAREVREKVAKHFPHSVLATPIRETVTLAESPGFGLSIFEYAASGNGALDYTQLANDYLQRRVLDLSAPASN